MKVPASIRALFDDQHESRVKLKTSVDALLRGRLHERWHYESRIKALESFTLKVESGRFGNPSALEDFFAASVVVRNGLEVAEAERLALTLFPLHQRRPRVDTETHKPPDRFPFDDLRLYVRWKDADSMPPTGLDGIVFELQVKTFLQHAWAIATHDLYKSADADWSKMRIAFQIKAMLEHAEVSIQEAAKLSQCDGLAKSDPATTSLKSFIQLVTDVWEKDDLPVNVRRLAENVSQLAKLVHLDADGLRTLLIEEKASGRGPLTRNLTPYGVVLQTLFVRRKQAFYDALRKKQSIRVLISKELELPNDANTAVWQSAVIL
jgi:hypothetical protein